MTRPLTIGVTGLNATDNPAPGVGVLRCLRHPDVGVRHRLVGLAYDALDPGVYASDVVDDVFLLPYPSQGRQAFEARIAHVHARVGLDVVIPTLDSELLSFIDAAPRLRAMGIGTLLPTREQVDLRAKRRLPELGELARIPVPRGVVLGGPDDLLRIEQRLPYPFFVKGPFYGATLVHSLDEAVAAYHKAIAQWGGPIIAQALVLGDEFNVVAVGDGQGGLVGAVPMKKTMLTDKGKGWAGITVGDPDLVRMAAALMRATGWRGPCELELIRDRAGGYHLLEINPRFPAWVFLAAAAGVNLPAAVVALAAGRPAPELLTHAVGRMFVRISLEQIVELSDFQRMVTAGELLRSGGAA